MRLTRHCIEVRLAVPGQAGTRTRLAAALGSHELDGAVGAPGLSGGVVHEGVDQGRAHDLGRHRGALHQHVLRGQADCEGARVGACAREEGAGVGTAQGRDAQGACGGQETWARATGEGDETRGSAGTARTVADGVGGRRGRLDGGGGGHGDGDGGGGAGGRDGDGGARRGDDGAHIRGGRLRDRERGRPRLSSQVGGKRPRNSHVARAHGGQAARSRGSEGAARATAASPWCPCWRPGWSSWCR